MNTGTLISSLVIAGALVVVIGLAVLAIRWRLPSGTGISTGFRADDRREYARWLEGEQP